MVTQAAEDAFMSILRVLGLDRMGLMTALPINCWLTDVDVLLTERV